MNDKDQLQRNVRRAAGQHALRQIRAVVDEDEKNEAAKRRTLRWLLRYGWIVLLALAAVLARLTGVY